MAAEPEIQYGVLDKPESAIMSRPRKGALPSYRYHKARNCAVVTIDGHDHYLGPYDTPSSKQKYAALIRAWQQRQEQPQAEPAAPLIPNDHATINELILAFLKHARNYYRSNHGENKEAGCINDALAVLQEQGYGREPADAFRPRDLKKVREAMVAKDWSRTYINSQVNRVKRMFAYAAEEDQVSGSIYHALLAVKGLRKGTPGVRETKKVRPVPREHLKPVLDKAHEVLKAMLLFGYRTGARPGEICALKSCHLNRTGKVWVYQVPPDANKTEHHEQERKVYVGPRARKILEPWLEGLAAEAYVFSPIRSEQLRQKARRDARKTPLWPSHLKRLEAKRKVAPKRAKRDHYDPISLRRAVKRLCQTVHVPIWTPNRLRHNAATRFRRKYGIEVARILLGHRKLSTTEIYAEPNARKAMGAAFHMG
jgi:integrase